MNSRQKTIFIIISRSFLTRNILRSGTLSLLKERGHRIVIFFQAKDVPQYLRDEFEGAQVTLHTCDAPIRPLHRRVNRLKRYLIDTRTTRLVARFDTKKKVVGPAGVVSSVEKPSIRIFFELALVRVCGHLPPLRWLFRFLERHIFLQRHEAIEEYFNHYRPDVVVSTSLISIFDIAFIKAAHHRGIRTLSMPKGWDNVTKEYYPFLPDWFASPNEISSACAVTLQDMPPARVRTVGLPQFDWYARPKIRRTREEHLRAKGLDPSRKIIFFGSEGAWSQNDWRIAEMLYDWVIKEEFGMPAQLLIRPHYSDVQSSKFENLRGKPFVFVDDYPKVDFLVDKWDPTVADTIDFTNSILHSDVVINIASSLALDAACADKPIVLVSFGCEFAGQEDVTVPKLYGSDHMRWLEEAGGTDRADSSEELKKIVTRALANPAWRAEGRERLRTGLCYHVDGKSSERLANLVSEVIESN